MDEGLGAFNVALELERLRGAVNEGFATISGRLDGAMLRTQANEKDVEGLSQRADAQDKRIAALERKVWLAAGAAAALTGGSMAGFWQIMHG